jgi:hypothetical protein
MGGKKRKSLTQYRFLAGVEGTISIFDDDEEEDGDDPPVD